MAAETTPRRPLFKTSDIAGRVPPHNAEAEAAVLSASLTDGHAFVGARDVIQRSDDFFVDANQRIWEAMLDLHERKQPIDIQTVASALADKQRLQAIGGIAYLAKIVDATPAVAHVRAHARIVKMKARQRRLIETCQIIAAEGHDGKWDPDAFIEFARTQIANDVVSEDEAQLISISDAVDQRLDEHAEEWTGKRTDGAIRTGLRAFDLVTGGMTDGRSHVIAGFQGDGKSTLMFQALLGGCGQIVNGERVGGLLVSGEMLTPELSDRAIQCESGVTEDELHGRVQQVDMWDGENGRDPQTAIKDAQERFRAMPLEIYGGRQSLEGIVALIERARRKFEMADRIRFQAAKDRGEPAPPRTRLRILAVDYLQIMRLPEAEKRDVAIGKFTAGFKDLVMREKVHGMLGSQVNRSAAQAGGPPEIHQLIGSSAIESDADMITFVYRPVEHVGAEARDDLAATFGDYAQIFAGKKRQGARGGIARAAWQGEHFRFADPSDRQIEKWSAVMQQLKDKQVRRR